MQQLFMDLLFAVLYGVIIWAIHMVVSVLLPYIKIKLSKTQYAWAAEIISNAVRAFEQTVSGSGRGDEKFILVMEQVNRELGKLGIHLTDDQITILIESAVQTMNSDMWPALEGGEEDAETELDSSF